MSTMLNNRASAVMFALSAALVKAGFSSEILDGVRRVATVESHEDLAAAADLCAQLAVMFDGSDHAVTQAATRAYYVLADQSGRASQLCPACSFSMHLSQLHSVEARLGKDTGLGSHPLCGCVCQRGKG